MAPLPSLVIAFVLTVASTAHASVLDAPRESYQSGRLEEARGQLETLLYPLKLQDEVLERDAHVLLAAAYHALGDTGRATEEAVRGFGVFGDAPLDPLLFPPDFVAFARATRHGHDARIQALAAQREKLRRPPAPALSSPGVPSARTAAEPPSAAWSFVPFGAGQYKNGQPVKGTVLAVAEGVLASAAVTTLVVALSMRSPDGTYTPANAPTARTLNTVYLGSAYTLGAVYLYGVIDSLVHRR